MSVNSNYVYLALIVIFLLLFFSSNVEEFSLSSQFFEPSDNYSLMNRVNFYNRLRCVLGGSCNNQDLVVYR